MSDTDSEIAVPVPLLPPGLGIRAPAAAQDPTTPGQHDEKPSQGGRPCWGGQGYSDEEASRLHALMTPRRVFVNGAEQRHEAVTSYEGDRPRKGSVSSHWEWRLITRRPGGSRSRDHYYLFFESADAKKPETLRSLNDVSAFFAGGLSRVKKLCLGVPHAGLEGFESDWEHLQPLLPLPPRAAKAKAIAATTQMLAEAAEAKAEPLPQQRVSDRISVFWPAEKAWFAGTLLVVTDGPGSYVKFDDGDTQLLNLKTSKNWRPLSPAAASDRSIDPPRAKRAKRAAAEQPVPPGFSDDEPDAPPPAAAIARPPLLAIAAPPAKANTTRDLIVATPDPAAAVAAAAAAVAAAARALPPAAQTLASFFASISPPLSVAIPVLLAAAAASGLAYSDLEMLRDSLGAEGRQLDPGAAAEWLQVSAERPGALFRLLGVSSMVEQMRLRSAISRLPKG